MNTDYHRYHDFFKFVLIRVHLCPLKNKTKDYLWMQ